MSESKEQSIPQATQPQRLPIVWEIAVVTKDQSSTISVVFPAKQALEAQQDTPVHTGKE